MERSEAEARRSKMSRPVGVWLIVLYGALNTLSATYLLSRGAIYDGLITRVGPIEFAVSISEQFCLIGGAIGLFMLKKWALAVYLFVAVLNVALTWLSLRH